MKYELTVILDFASGKHDEILAQISQAIEAVEGKVVQQDDWGLKQLSYPIDKKKSGHYYFFQLEMPKKAPRQLEKKLRLMTEVIRYLIVREQ